MPLTILNLAGSVALLLWGRAHGPNRRSAGIRRQAAQPGTIERAKRLCDGGLGSVSETNKFMADARSTQDPSEYKQKNHDRERSSLYG